MIAHYTTMSTFLDHIKPCGHLRLSSFSKLNDLYENKQQITIILDDNDPSDYSEGKLANTMKRTVDWPPEISSILQHKIKAGCFVFDPNNPTSIEQATFWNNPPMWTHYGDNNKGVILTLPEIIIDSLFYFFERFGWHDFNKDTYLPTIRNYLNKKS